ncbi:alpha/beta hydrolase [Streptomyces triticagri]|uniref:Alpha/beta hydrolase n=1 Tax=Streptomyces triticagri TaxID=2293568 RepID=A0A372LWW5_9ACTN|nr:alpha/beta hydrolase [Streptomyces triticagri]RFU82785.1 alpha/beta hydrolase [Streptomyces triticagri]
MKEAVVNGVTLEYETRGSGEPVILLHGGLLADENKPLVDQPALTDHYQVVNYHRRGFAGSTRTNAPTSIEEQAADCAALLRHLGLGPAHLIGHSLGGAIALQTVLAEPESVRSLTLLEPALMGQIAKAKAQGDPGAKQSQQQFTAAFDKVLEVARTGDKRAALMAFLESRAGDAFRGVLDFLTASGEMDQAVRDADTFLQIEMPAAFAWNFTAADAARIHRPVLSVLGAHSPQRAQMVHSVLSEWIPQTRLLVLDAAEHALPLMDPPGLASGVAHFLTRQSDPRVEVSAA